MHSKIVPVFLILGQMLLIACSPPQDGGVRGIENDAACLSGASTNSPCTTLDFDYTPEGEIAAVGHSGATTGNLETADSSATPSGQLESLPNFDDEGLNSDFETFSRTTDPHSGSSDTLSDTVDSSSDSPDSTPPHTHPSGSSSNQNGLMDKIMNSVLGKVMGTIGNLFGSGDKKKKEKEKEIQEKVRQTEDIGRKIEALVTSSRDSYRDDFNKLEEMTSGSFSKPKEIRKLVQKKAEGYNKNLGEIANRRPDITDEKNASNASPNDPESNCNEMHDCNLNTPEQRKLKGVKDYIAGAREYVKGAYSGDDAKEREGILDSADSLTDAASAHYRNGDIELGDETVELAKKVADIVVGATPVVGDIVDIASAITGKNLITDEPLSDEEAIIQVASALTSLATGGYVGTINDIRKGGNVLKEAIKQHVKKEAKKEAKKQAGDIARKEGERRMKQAEEGERQAKDANKKETAEDFYRSNRDKPPGERVAAIRTKADALAKEKGMQKDNKISKMNNRTVYKDNDGSYWSVDTLHGTFEKLDSKGRHQGEYDFDFKIIDGTQDRSGGHDLRIQ